MTPEQREYGSKMFGALASPARLQILERLSQSPASVKEISEATGLKQSMTSQHLAILLAAGVVVVEPKANVRIYSLRGPRIAKILELLAEFYQVHLSSLREVIEKHSNQE